MKDLSGKTALVTGSTDGVGRLVARRLAEAGARVLVHGRNAERGEALVAEIERPAARRSSCRPISARSPRCADSPIWSGRRPTASTS